MDPIIFILLAAALIAVAFYLVALPLLQHVRRNAPAASTVNEQERLAELLAQRDAAFQALRELSFDHRVGKITAEDFVAFEATLKQNAAETLRALDRWEAESDDELDLFMERAVDARKSALSGATVELDGRACPKCGKPAAAGDRFCGKCGSALPVTSTPPARPAASLTCPKCGQPHEAGDKFCARCGQVLTAEVAPVGR